MAGGSASALSLSRPAQASLTLRPTGSLSHPRRPLSRGSSPASYPAKPLVSYRTYRQLSGWIPPPQVFRALGAHCHKRTSMAEPIPTQNETTAAAKRLDTAACFDTMARRRWESPMTTIRKTLFVGEALQIGLFHAQPSTVLAATSRGKARMPWPSLSLACSQGPCAWPLRDRQSQSCVFFAADTPYRIGFPGAVGDRALILRFGEGFVADQRRSGGGFGSYGLLPADAMLLRNLLWARLQRSEADTSRKRSTRPRSPEHVSGPRCARTFRPRDSLHWSAAGAPWSV